MNHYKGLVGAVLCMISMNTYAKKKSKKVVQKKTAPIVTVVAPNPAPETTRCPVVKVINNITPEMTTYKHWTKDYTPTTFEVRVNGESLAHNEQKEIPVQDNVPLKVTYKYSFLNGYRTGEKEETFTVSPAITEPIALEFSWKSSPEHVSLRRIAPNNGTSKVKEVAQ